MALKTLRVAIGEAYLIKYQDVASRENLEYEYDFPHCHVDELPCIADIYSPNYAPMKSTELQEGMVCVVCEIIEYTTHNKSFLRNEVYDVGSWYELVIMIDNKFYCLEQERFLRWSEKI
jgi:hypothetical protein